MLPVRGYVLFFLFLFIFFFFETKFRCCYPGWSSVVWSRLTETSASWVQVILLPPPQVAGITGMCHHVQLIFVCLVEKRFHHDRQAGLELLISSDPPASTSQSAGITGVQVWATAPALCCFFLECFPGVIHCLLPCVVADVMSIFFLYFFLPRISFYSCYSKIFSLAFWFLVLWLDMI